MSQVQLSLDSFSAHKNSEFVLRRESGATVVITLHEATAIESVQNRADGSKAFSLVFRAPKSAAVGQGVHAIEHLTLGEQAIFLVPVGQEADSTLLEAVFN